MQPVLGIHHVTAIASDPQRNLDFYAGVLGLRFVKRTVNFDDPYTYHFYFGDEQGSPGSIMTFFPWPGARRGRQGVGQVGVTSFAVLPTAIGFWVERLVQHGVKFEAPAKRVVGGDTEQLIAFQDPDGLLVEIVGHASAEARRAWERAAGIPKDKAIRGFHRVALWENDGGETERVLVDALGFRATHEFESNKRYVAGDGGAGTIVDVRSVGGFARGNTGAGTVHHVAFRVADDDAQLEVRRQAMTLGLSATPVIDRTYFHSVYFREPGGVLFELATDAPGFAVDESPDHLGEALLLPEQHEPLRAAIETVLPPIHLPGATASGETSAFARGGGPEDVSGDALGFVHRYVPPAANSEYAGRVTLLMLHGTGGDEDDLVPLARTLLPGAAIVSPRGKVLERGAPRFFRRIREGVFDQEDMRVRTAELATFIEGAAKTYGLDPEGIVAVGFSNGANIAGSVLLRRPGLLKRAVLLSPMVPFEPDDAPRLKGTAVFIGAGRTDPICPPEQTERLAAIFREHGADVTLHWHPGGHTLTPDEIQAAQSWLSSRTQ